MDNDSANVTMRNEALKYFYECDSAHSYTSLFDVMQGRISVLENVLVQHIIHIIVDICPVTCSFSC